MSQTLCRIAFMTAMLSVASCIAGRSYAQEPEQWVTKIYKVEDVFVVPNDFPLENMLPAVEIDPAAKKTASGSFGVGVAVMGAGGAYGGSGMGGGGGYRGGKGARSSGGMPGAMMGGATMMSEDMGMMMGGGMAGMGSSPRATQPFRPLSALKTVTIEDIEHALTEAVSPRSWNNEGGEGRIAVLQNTLLIRQTPENHKRIQDLLQGLSRQQTPRSVRIRVYWLTLPDASAAAYQVGNPAPDRFKTDLQSDQIFVSELACNEGQTVHLASGDQVTLVTDVTPIISADVKSTHATLLACQLGTAVQITPTIVSKSRCRLALSGWFADGATDRAATSNLDLVAAPSNPLAITAATFDVDLTVDVEKPVTAHRVTFHPAVTAEEHTQLVLVTEVSLDP